MPDSSPMQIYIAGDRELGQRSERLECSSLDYFQRGIWRAGALAGLAEKKLTPAEMDWILILPIQTHENLIILCYAILIKRGGSRSQIRSSKAGLIIQ